MKPLTRFLPGAARAGNPDHRRVFPEAGVRLRLTSKARPVRSTMAALFVLALAVVLASGHVAVAATSVQVAPVAPSDSPATIIAKAAEVVPAPRQLAWQRLERYNFLHFGVNTFTGREWGTGTENPNVFQPTNLNTDQWATTM
jgi:alpha-L-fucosidase